MMKARLIFSLFFCLAASLQAEKSADDGIALGLVYDTSGSMLENVATGRGKTSPKYIVANRALEAVIQRLENFSTGTDAKKLEANLVVFNGATGYEAVPYGSFQPKVLRSWIKSFNQPTGSTPLGEAIRVAAEPVLKSPLKHKHILILTDGQNTAGADPATVLPQLLAAAKKQNANIAFHFIAFDVAAKVFEPVKKLGATVLGAANEGELNMQLTIILDEKILLEAEEPATKTETKK